MKLIVTISLLLLCVAGQSQANYSYFTIFEGKRFKVNEQSTVKDTAGNVINYADWSTLMQTGDYILKPYNVSNGTPTEILIRRLTSEELDAIRDQMQGGSQMKYAKTQNNSFINFFAKDINGKEWNLSNLKGKIVVLNFWFTACKPCIAEIPELNKLVENYKNKDIVFLAISNNDTPDVLKAFLNKRPFQYQIISGEYGQKISQDNGIMLYPTHIIIDKEGKIYKSYTGFQEELVQSLRSDLNNLTQ